MVLQEEHLSLCSPNLLKGPRARLLPKAPARGRYLGFHRAAAMAHHHDYSDYYSHMEDYGEDSSLRPEQGAAAEVGGSFCEGALSLDHSENPENNQAQGEHVSPYENLDPEDDLNNQEPMEVDPDEPALEMPEVGRRRPSRPAISSTSHTGRCGKWRLISKKPSTRMYLQGRCWLRRILDLQGLLFMLTWPLPLLVPVVPITFQTRGSFSPMTRVGKLFVVVTGNRCAYCA